MAAYQMWRIARLKSFHVFLIFLCTSSSVVMPLNNFDKGRLRETIVIVFFARNKAHTLPYFLGWLEKLDYPKNRIILWIRSDHSVDNTNEVLNSWLREESHFYHDVNFQIDSVSTSFDDELSYTHWSTKRFRHVIRMKEEALQAARMMWADFIWFLDCDIFLINNQTLNELIEYRHTISAPMLESLGAYSNYWCGMNEKFYYQRTEDYLPVLERKKRGSHSVSMVHSSVLVDLRMEESVLLSFDPSKNKKFNVPEDDIIAFALSAKAAGISMHVINENVYGSVMLPLEAHHRLTDDYEQLINIKVQTLCKYKTIEPSIHLSDFEMLPQSNTLGFDEVYLINLRRRSDRRNRMLSAFRELGIRAEVVDAVDGQQLNETFLKTNRIKMLNQYQDPYHKRAMTMGEIGCFLSHYNIWQDVIRKQHRAVIVFEDDIQFEPYFRKKLQKMIEEMRTISLDWDLVYLGRKRLLEKEEPYLNGATTIVKVEYSYWTLCYILTLRGAEKLIAADPLPKMVPVDEFLPIMFDKHPEPDWKLQFPVRNLKAFSAAPLLVFPTHYTGEEDYISDTEDSQVIKAHSEL